MIVTPAGEHVRMFAAALAAALSDASNAFPRRSPRQIWRRLDACGGNARWHHEIVANGSSDQGDVRCWRKTQIELIGDFTVVFEPTANGRHFRLSCSDDLNVVRAERAEDGLPGLLL